MPADGEVCISSALCTVMPKELKLDTSAVSVLYSDNIPYLSGNVMSETGDRITYTVKSEVSEDRKKMTVRYSDIASLDLNFITPSELILEFDLVTRNENTYYIYAIYACAALAIIVFCLMLSLFKRK